MTKNTSYTLPNTFNFDEYFKQNSKFQFFITTYTPSRGNLSYIETKVDLLVTSLYSNWSMIPMIFWESSSEDFLPPM